MSAKPTLKRGRLSEDEKTFVQRSKGNKTVEQMAAHLRRPVSTIEKFLAEGGETAKVEKVGLAGRLEERPEWAQLRNRFDDDELKFFVYRYKELLSQFGSDEVTTTEDMQILQLCELEIMSHQTMHERKPVVKAQKALSRELDGLYDVMATMKTPTKQVRAQADEVESRLAGVSQQLQDINKRNDSYLARINGLLKDLKSTRDQRIKVVQSGDKNFLGFLRRLTADESYRTRVSQEAEHRRVATEKEQKRLQKPFRYDDGQVDHPLLTPESVAEQYADDEIEGAPSE